MNTRLCILLCGKNIYYECLKTKCSEKYLDLRRLKIIERIRILHREELRELPMLDSKIMKMLLVEQVSTVGETRNA